MDAELPGLVQSSCNTGSLVIKTGAGDRLDAVCLPRSSVDEEKLALLARIAGLWKEVGVATRIPSLMPAWRESPTSPFVGLVAEAYRRVAGAEPRVTASHGGLECAILSRSYPDLAMVAVGPTITNPHSPAEALKIDTVGRLYRLIAEVAARLA
jgi:dipeptidase D